MTTILSSSRRALLLGALALTPSGCGHDGTPTEPSRLPTPSPPQVVQLSAGERVTVPGTALVLTYEQLDRPATNASVDCLPGPCGPFSESARFLVATPTNPGYRTMLYLEEPAGRDVTTFDGFTIRLVRFVPAYDRSAPLPGTAYAAVFAVSR